MAMRGKRERNIIGRANQVVGYIDDEKNAEKHWVVRVVKGCNPFEGSALDRKHSPFRLSSAQRVRIGTRR